jgi:hypothetical protein
MQMDAARDDGAQSQQGGQVEHIGPDDDPGAEPLLLAGYRGHGRGHLGIGRHAQ